MKRLAPFVAVGALTSLAFIVATGCGTAETATSQGTGSAQGGSTSQGNSSGSSNGGAGGMTSGGGSAAGGNSQGGGSAAGGSGQGGMNNGGAPECVTDADCSLVNNCCDCAGVPTGTTLPCGINECLVPMCQQYEPPTIAAACKAGQCVTTIDCDISQVSCKIPEPTCPAGSTPTYDGNGCYGPCAPITECSSVGSCAQCESDQTCVTQVTMLGPQITCVPVEPACNGTATCACMGASVCVAPYDTCQDTQGDIQCQCLNC